MATEITFRGWRRPAIGAFVETVQDGRPLIRTTVEMVGRDADGAETGRETVRLQAFLAGPGDVARLQSGAIAGRFPAPGAVDAETTMCPYVEFRDPGLPWRYTPRRNPDATDRRLGPWLSLLVGTDEELDAGSDQASISAPMLRAHPLGQSPSTAHVQEAGDTTLARLLCRRRPLQPDTWYQVLLVPNLVVVDGGLSNAWSRDQQTAVTLRVFAQWRFHTGPGGDFRTLATKLRPGDANSSTGLASVGYPRVAGAPTFQVGGALTAVPGEDSPGDVPPDEPLPDGVPEDLRGLRTRGTDEDGRTIVGLPTYGDAWHEAPDDTTWGGPLNGDPRHRGVAGLGLKLGVELQEELAGLVAKQAGALAAAAERVRHLALGEAASEALWRRRLPANANRRLWLLGPALRRVMTQAGPVEALATADDRALARGWFSTAARRALRRGPARTALAQPVAADPARLNSAANRPPPPVPFAEAGLPRFDSIAPDFERRRGEVVRGNTAPADRMLGGMVASLNMNRFPRHVAQLAAVQARAVQSMEEGRPLPWVQLTLLLSAVGGGEDDANFDEPTAAPLIKALAEDFDGQVDGPEIIPALLRDLGDVPDPRPPSRPIDLDRTAADLLAAFDPTGADAPARRRVLGTIDGLDPARPLEPPEPCPGLEIPMWSRLARMDPDWLLPGVGQLLEDTVFAVGTNPVFIDAFLAGFNTRALEELRWRNLRVATGCTPVRTFWFRADPAGGGRVDDIVGIQRWEPDSRLGGAQHRPGGLSGSDLVLVFRGRLFNRYPNTLLYLVSARQGGQVDFSGPPAPNAPHTLPTFQGRIGADVTFFGFVGVDPDAVEGLWVALEEPPSGFKFRNDRPDANAAADGAAFADLAFDNPVRVLIQGDYLVPRRPA